MLILERSGKLEAIAGEFIYFVIIIIEFSMLEEDKQIIIIPLIYFKFHKKKTFLTIKENYAQWSILSEIN